MTAVTIKSSEDDTVLTIFNLELGRDGLLKDFGVRVQRSNLDCTISVDGYLSEGFGQFFEDLDTCMIRDGGWSGAKSWASLEGEFSLEATADSLGHTTLIVSLKSGHYDLDWRLDVGLQLDASQVSAASKDVRLALQSARA